MDVPTGSQPLQCVRDVVSSYAGHIMDTSVPSGQIGVGAINSAAELLPPLTEH